MKHTHILIIFMLCIAGNAMALQNEFSVWTQYRYAGHFEEDPRLKREFEAQLRFNREGRNDLRLLLLRGGLGYEVKPAVIVLGGYEWTWAPHGLPHDQRVRHENILYEQLSWSFSPTLNFRTRVEEREFTDQIGWNVRLRQIGYVIRQKPLFWNFQPMASNELFLLLNHPNWVTSSTFDQNRFFVGFQVRMTHDLWWQLGYMNQYIEQNHAIGAVMNHIAYISLGYL